MGFKDGVRYLLGVFVGVGLFFGENSCVQKTLQEKKKEDFKHKHALGEGRGVEDGPATKNRGRNTNRKGSKTALSLPKNGTEREGLGCKQGRQKVRAERRGTKSMANVREG